MKRLLLTSAAALALYLTTLTVQSQVISQNIVGYINLPLYVGDNWIANQLDDLNGNFLNSIITGAPDGSTFTKWDSAANQFLPLSIYSAQSQSWSINYSFNLLEGGVLHSPTAGVNTFVGTVSPTYMQENTVPPYGFHFLYDNYPHYGPGLYLLACPEPIGGASFTNVVGRAPQDGEWVRMLDNSTQTYTLTTFHAATGTWDNGDPLLAVGQSAFYDLGPVSVPEPTTFALAGLGAVLVLRRRLTRH